MKRMILKEIAMIRIAVFCLLMCSCKVDSNKNDYLQKVYNNLVEIESATYYAINEDWAPGDSLPSLIAKRYYKEYSNLSDSTIGSSFVELLQEDTTQMTFCYDGNMRAVVDSDEKTIVIDSFKVRKLPFRPLSAPFFNYTKSIINYALETKDSITREIEDYGDSVLFRLTIYEDKQVEFFGKAYYMDSSPYNPVEPTSKYELWINKSNDLPFRVRREMSHDITVSTCSNIELNKASIESFIANDYFLTDYKIVAYGSGKKSADANDLIGKTASNWILKDVEGNAYKLSDFKSRALMIQFTSVNCGPCRASIPFLKQLALDYSKKDFNFISIESWTKNMNVLKVYQERNDFNFIFLMSNEDVTRSYQIQSTPVFYILDSDRVIRKVIKGYGPGSTDKEIKDTINNLI